MKYSLYFLIFLISSCVPNYNNFETKKPFLSKGFAYIYNDQDYENKIIKKRLDKHSLSVAHDKLRIGSFNQIHQIACLCSICRTRKYRPQNQTYGVFLGEESDFCKKTTRNWLQMTKIVKSAI